MAERQQIIRHVPASGKGFEAWYGYIPRTQQWLWLLDLYWDGQAVGGGRYLRKEDVLTAGMLWQASVLPVGEMPHG